MRGTRDGVHVVVVVVVVVVSLIIIIIIIIVWHKVSKAGQRNCEGDRRVRESERESEREREGRGQKGQKDGGIR